MWEDDWFTWSLMPTRRTRQMPFGITNFNDIFNRLEKIQNEQLIIFNQLNFDLNKKIEKKLSQLIKEIIFYKNEF